MGALKKVTVVEGFLIRNWTFAGSSVISVLSLDIVNTR
jgi:hypothetical protein